MQLKTNGEVIGYTTSVCPVCLRQIEAERLKIGDSVYIRKACPDHGQFQSVIWRGKPDYLTWYREKEPEYPKVSLTEVAKGCPYDCGLCPSHSQQICCSQIEVTERCNLRCPICFADAGRCLGEGPEDNVTKDPPVADIVDQLRIIWNTTGKCNIQLSGGEPTVRDDLPEIITAARQLGYTFFQLNTNGIRLAEDPEYVRALKDAGLSTVFLQFDGMKDEIYRDLRGKDLFALKEKAIDNCGRNHLGVVLVPTLVPGVNTDQIGEIVRYALKGMPVIRGVHFQPVSYFGRYPEPPDDRDRITLPEVLRALEEQTDGLLKMTDFAPSDCESALCSFHGDFVYFEDGKLTSCTPKKNTCCSSENNQQASVIKAQNFVAQRWEIQNSSANCSPGNTGKQPLKEPDSWDAMLDRLRNYRLSITCMTFQDAENIDLERLKYCCVPVIVKGKAIPFCAYNLTSRDGRSLYRGK
ncbi:radical SAM protein [Dehalobacter sp. DCM]|uniref:radical SAM (seleno)protein TrsS n=1 Tax=Dehalobacter sp. DCM TaxID=2907827 RepID=UPI003081C29B|nr:radical SAM protein [Dehalobacter sp. DCM]